MLHADFAGTFTNQVLIGGNELDTNPLNNETDLKTHVNNPAALSSDVSVSQIALPSVATVSNSLTYAVTVRNTGPNDATGVVLTEDLAPGLTFVGSTPAPAAVSGNTLTFALGGVPNSSIGETVVTILLQPTNASIVTSVASVQADQSDPNYDNNEAAVTTAINPPSPNKADLTLNLSESTNVITAGDQLTYTLVVTNTGPNDASGVTIANTLPADVTLVSVTPGQGTSSTAGNMVTVNLGTISNAATAQVTIRVKSLFASPITDSANVFAAEQDPAGDNNSASINAMVLNATNGVVAIVRNFDNIEITQLQSYLAEMGLTSQVFDQGGDLTFDALKNFKLVIWDDLSYASGGITPVDVDVYQAVADAGIPLYFIGDDLALSATFGLSGTPESTNWVNLIHLQATDNNYGGNRTFTLVDHSHPVVNGPFGLVGDSNYSLDPDATSRTGTGETLLGVSGPNDVLVSFKDSVTGRKSVTQNVVAYDGSPDQAGIAEMKKLFKNAVTWLLATDPAADISLSGSLAPASVAAGQFFTYRLAVANNGPLKPAT